jgi:hypothetical protein
VAAGLSAPLGYAVIYFAACAQSALSAPRLSAGSTVRLPVVYATMHGAWGLGFLRGVPRDERSAAGAVEGG